MGDKNINLFLFFLLSLSSINAADKKIIKKKPKEDNNTLSIHLSKIYSLKFYIQKINKELKEIYDEFFLYSKTYIFSNYEIKKYNKEYEKFKFSINDYKYKIKNNYTTDIKIKIERLFNHINNLLDYYNEYLIIIKLDINKDIEIQRSAITTNIKKEHINIESQINEIVNYLTNIKKVKVKKQIKSIDFSNDKKRIIKSNIQLLVSELLKLKENKDFNITSKYNIFKKIIDGIMLERIPIEYTKYNLKINKLINELFEKYNELKKIKQEGNSKKEEKFINLNINLDMNLIFEYSEKYLKILNK